MKKHIRLAVTTAALWASFSMQKSDAVELNVPNVPQGIVAPLILDMPPIPGIFGLAMATYQPSYDLVGPKGDKVPIPFNGQGTGVAARFLLSYGELFGGHFYQQIVLPFVKVDTTIFGQSSSDFGLANFTAAPALVVWNLTDRQSFALGLEIATPWGTPRVTTGYATWAPTAAYRYNDPEGFTAAVMPRILLNSYHDKTQYQSPTAFLVDFNTGWNFTKDLRIGLAGSFATQFEEDMQFGSKLRGTKFANLMLGPSITYNFGNFVMIFSYQPSIYTRNYATQNLFTLAIAAPLYIPPPPATR